MMHRRGFLGTLAGLFATVTVAPRPRGLMGIDRYFREWRTVLDARVQRSHNWGELYNGHGMVRLSDVITADVFKPYRVALERESSHVGI